MCGGFLATECQHPLGEALEREASKDFPHSARVNGLASKILESHSEIDISEEVIEFTIQDSALALFPQITADNPGYFLGVCEQIL